MLITLRARVESVLVLITMLSSSWERKSGCVRFAGIMLQRQSMPRSPTPTSTLIPEVNKLIVTKSPFTKYHLSSVSTLQLPSGIPALEINDLALLVLAESTFADILGCVWRPGFILGFGVKIGLEFVVWWKRGFHSISSSQVLGIRFDTTVLERSDRRLRFRVLGGGRLRSRIWRGHFNWLNK